MVSSSILPYSSRNLFRKGSQQNGLGYIGYYYYARYEPHSINKERGPAEETSTAYVLQVREEYPIQPTERYVPEPVRY